MVERRLEVLMKSLPTLLRGSRSDLLRYADPIVRSIAVDEFNQPPVFMLRPRAATVSHHDVCYIVC